VFIKLTPAVIGNVVGPAESEKYILDFVIFIDEIVAPALTDAAVVLAAVLIFFLCQPNFQDFCDKSQFILIKKLSYSFMSRA
jgi:hypothetical protein